jgi:hypothetical protein
MKEFLKPLAALTTIALASCNGSEPAPQSTEKPVPPEIVTQPTPFLTPAQKQVMETWANLEDVCRNLSIGDIIQYGDRLCSNLNAKSLPSNILDQSLSDPDAAILQLKDAIKERCFDQHLGVKNPSSACK